MSYPNLLEIEIGDKNEKVLTPAVINHQKVIIKNEIKDKNKSRITYYTIIIASI